jgi:hypothetical protein
MANYFVRSTSSIVLLTLMSLLHFSLLAQKPLIDTGVDKTWPGVSGPVVSNNGKFVLYWIENHGNMSLVLRSTVSGKNICFPNAGEAYFTQDNEKAIFKRNDSIGIIKLDAEDLVQYIKGIGSFALVKTSTNTDLLLYGKWPGETICRY